MLTANCTQAAIDLNDSDGSKRRSGVDFSKLALSDQWQWVNVNREVRLAGGRLEVRQHSATDCFGPRTLSHALRSKSAPLSHAKMLAELLGNV